MAGNTNFVSKELVTGKMFLPIITLSIYLNFGKLQNQTVF